MNSQKVEQALKEILETKGQEIVQNHGAFKAAVFDLLDDIHFAEERLVLKHAMDANAFWTLLGSGSPTADGVKRAVEQLAKECHMQKEDAEFVVHCIAAAKGENPNIINTVRGDTVVQNDIKADIGTERKTDTVVQNDTATPQPQTADNAWIAVTIGVIGVLIGWFFSGLFGMALGVIGMIMGTKTGKSKIKTICIVLGVISIIFWIITVSAA